MSWTGHDDVVEQLSRLWAKGDLLRDVVLPEGRFPFRLVLKTPGTTDIANRFDEVRTWAAVLREIPNVRIEWREVRHRVQGLQRVPSSVWIDSIDDALILLQKVPASRAFAELVATTESTLPALVPWLLRRPLIALQYAAEWPKLLIVVSWLRAHPRPGVFLRQVDLPDIDTKFIERHRGLLPELLDLILPPEAIDSTKSGVAQFAGRYGFTEKPTRIRYRELDPQIASLPGPVCADIALDAKSFSELKLSIDRVFITENETNFLAFPLVPRSIVVFGAGYGWDALSLARWLDCCTIYYWGDIDTHGFGILNQLRSHFSAVASFLMDRETLDAHSASWGRETAPLMVDLLRLTSDECRVYDDLRYQRIQPDACLRLEQEHIGYHWVMTRLAALLR
ncbi:DUF3322 domain-containing protein [Robbsia sp. KACC 23696]|uniref:DUF3322 domain-containing protein n=1 Tax=Robbsia sp. KACC 23696 TaxID=3149231 RepID=UPI00325BB173